MPIYNFSDVIAQSKKLSHFMGLDKSLLEMASAVLAKDLVDLESSTPESSLGWIGGYLNRMKEEENLSEENPYISRLAAAFNQASELCKKDNTVLTATCLDKINNNELVVLPAGWHKHSISIAILSNRLIVTNTGEGSGSRPGTLIYPIDPSKITIDTLASLMKQTTQEELQQAIVKITLAEPPLYHAHTAQKVGNCSVSNPKKSIEEILVCLKVLESSSDMKIKTVDLEKELKKLDSYKGVTLFKKITAQMRSYAKTEYQEFDRCIRLQADLDVDSRGVLDAMQIILKAKRDRKEISSYFKAISAQDDSIISNNSSASIDNEKMNPFLFFEKTSVDKKESDPAKPANSTDISKKEFSISSFNKK